VTDRLEGRKSIADYLGRSESWTRIWGRRRRDPLPVHRLGKIVYAYRTEIDEWLADREARVSARSRGRIANTAAARRAALRALRRKMDALMRELRAAPAVPMRVAELAADAFALAKAAR
jgi:hypothetical protein